MWVKDAHDRSVLAVEELARRADVVLSPKHYNFLETTAETLAKISAEDKPVMDSLGGLALLGFFDAATDGHEFIDREIIFKRFHGTVANNYPEAGPAFLRFANSYWTLKTLVDDLKETEPYSGLTGVLGAVIDKHVGPLFFPVPGPVKIPASRREADQRSYLDQLAPRVDIEEFMQHNPILLRDRKSATGCLIAVALIGPAIISRMITGS